MKRFLTEYPQEDGMYAGEIFAETAEEAEEIAKERQKGEKIISLGMKVRKNHSESHSVELPASKQNPVRKKQ